MTGHWVSDLVASLFLLLGLFFMATGALGLIRLPDVYHRMHAATKCTTLGVVGLMLAAVVHISTAEVATKASIVIIFTFVAAPVGSHMLAKAALRTKARQWQGTLSDEHSEDGCDEQL